MLVDLPVENVKALVEHFDSDLYENGSIDESTACCIIKLAKTFGVKTGLRQCGGCKGYASNQQVYSNCCGYLLLEVGDEVLLPYTEYEGWTEAELAIITGFETIDNDKHAICLSKTSGRSWCISVESLER